MGSSENLKKINVVFRSQDQKILEKITESKKDLTMSEALRNMLRYIIPSYSPDELYTMMSYEEIQD